jgi:hypothetical protein
LRGVLLVLDFDMSSTADLMSGVIPEFIYFSKATNALFQDPNLFSYVPTEKSDNPSDLSNSRP